MRLRSSDSAEAISQQWIDTHVEEIFPFPGTFLAFHYDGTNRIQVNPNRTFRASARVVPHLPNKIDGFGYYTLGHEMLHYALESTGIGPTRLHHCLFLFRDDSEKDRGLMDQLASFLVDEGFIAPFTGYRGLLNERMFRPCKRLTSEELGLVRSLYSQIDPGGVSGGQRNPR